VKRFSVVVFVCLVVPFCLQAQTGYARLSGTVSDVLGGRLPGAQMTVQNTALGVTLTTATNEAGLYSFPSLSPGTYQLSAELPGFQKVSYNEVVLEVLAQVSVNIEMRPATLGQDVQVTATVDSPLTATTATVSGVITGVMVRDLPLPARNALGLVLTQGGLLGDNFAGARIGTLNVARDGINVMDQRINSGVDSVITLSTDLVDEVRVVTSPADAELGRGSGQVQVSTKSGTNQFHGTLFESHRNTVLNANTWFNNLRGNPRNFLIRNQFGGGLGGPIQRNKTFFFFLYDGQRQVTKATTTATTYTQTARQGIFRFFPGVQNGNANAAVPVVDLAGNSLRPATAAGDLQSISVFGRDPNRPVADTTGIVQTLIDLMPLPNNFRTGDGLNTAGYTWNRRATSDRDQYNVKIDHYFNERHRLAAAWTRETEFLLNGFLPQPYPQSPGGTSTTNKHFYSLSLTSTLSSRMVNEFHAGAQRAQFRFNAPWELEEGKAVTPTINGIPYLSITRLSTDPIATGNDPQGRISPFYVWGDTLTWNRGSHSFKFGGEARFGSSNGFNSFDVMPRANFGAGGAAVTGLTAASIAGLGNNELAAQDLLIDLSGSLSNVVQAFNATAGLNPVFLAGEGKQRTWVQREFSWFVKDDWQLSPTMMINLGLRYEWYGVPWEANGKTAGVVGGSKGLFGLSGTSFADLYQPGHLTGSLTAVELVGKNSVNPDTRLYDDDWNNFAPAVGLSWSIPYFGRNKTVLRAGYSIGYERNSLRLVDIVAGDQPGLRSRRVFQSASYLDLSRIQLPLTPLEVPLAVVPLTDRVQTVRAFDNNLRTAYVQNWNLSIQRDLPARISLSVRYLGSKGTKLIRGANINEVNIFETGILDAFRITQAGGDAPLLNQIFNGLNLGLGAVNGTTVTGSASVRSNANTRGFFAGNNPAGFASYLNSTANFTGTPGGLIQRAGLPVNWVVGNPQFSASNFTGNFANSTYHGMIVDMNRRFANGFTLASNYTWSKALGEEEGDDQEMLDSFRDGRNRALEKRLMSFHRTHVMRNSGTYELPLGSGRRFLGGASGIVARLVERWQIGAIVNLFSGQPIGFSSAATSFNQFTGNTPTLVGQLPKSTGQVVFDATGVTYFQGLGQVADPAIATITTNQALQSRSTMKAIVDANGNVLAINPPPGQVGNMDPRYLQGPGEVRFDVNLVKRVRIGEGKTFEFRADAIGLLNHVNFENPNTDINSTSFGRITGATGNRLIVLNARISF
jgi:hypothetical protein